MPWNKNILKRESAMLLNAQEIFNKVATHLFAQGERSIETDFELPTCLYRGPNGTKCAVGALIPDEEYDERLEYKGVRSLPSVAEEIRQSHWRTYKTPFIDSLNEEQNSPVFELLAGLQEVHDSIDSWDSTDAMKYSLRSVARSNSAKIDTSILDNLSFNGW